jgi:hypothetical protein
MGRTDEVRVILEVNAEMRRLLPRIDIAAIDGWESRGNGLSGDYEGGIVHHTASRSRSTNPFPTKNILLYGRSDLPGPLCNYGGPWCTEEDPKIVVVAAFPANHAGASGGRSMGPLPVTRSFNKTVLGLEIDYYGAEPMTDGQMLVAEVWSRAVANVVGGGDIQRIRAHMETSITGKWDPGAGRMGVTIDMAAFRRRAAARAAGGSPTPTPTPTPEGPELDATERKMLETIHARLTEPNVNDKTLFAAMRDLHGAFAVTEHDRAGIPADAKYPKGKAITLLRYADGNAQIIRDTLPQILAMLTKIAGSEPDVDEQALANALAPLLRPLLEDMVEAARTSDVTPDELVDTFLARAVAGTDQQKAAG